MSQQVVAQENILELRDVTVSFGMNRGVSKVLNDVSVDIHRGEILGVVGESGSGKSMLASALLDAVVNPGTVDGEISYQTDDGETVDVLDLNDDDLRRLRWEEIAMVFQGAMSFFNPTMKIRGHFLETLKAHDQNVDSGMEHARELLTDLHLEPERIFDTYPHELSGGMKQRALIALSLVLEPNVLVMDEPTAALDLLMQRSILTLLEDLQEKYDLTIVFITHDLPLVKDLCDRIAVMYAFEIMEVFPAGDLSNSTHPYTRSLLNAVPNLTTPLDELQSIEGSAPDPVEIPSGCSYHPRCPLSTAECQEEDPPLETVGPDQEVACWHYEEVDEELPLALEKDAGTIETYEGSQSDDPVVVMDDVEVHFQNDDGGLMSLFEDPEVVRAVDGVDLEIYDNDVVAIVGESGCGKTTLGKTGVGLQEPTGGSVQYRGQDIWESKRGNGTGDYTFDEIRRALQIIHQDPGSSLNPNRKISAVLQVPMKSWQSDLDVEDRKARVLAMLEAAGMTPPEDYADRYPHQLSGGEKQRVALIRALLMNPDLILADEAVSALDVSMRVDMMDLMLTLQDLFDTSYLFISHNLTNARYLAGRAGGRIAVMYLGEIIEIGPAEEIVQDPQHPYTQALHWSTTDLDSEDETTESPIREIDVPDPIDPPSGCRFHPRCPEAREVCASETPSLDSETDHCTACFREYPEDHPYWDSEPLGERTETIDATAERESP